MRVRMYAFSEDAPNLKDWTITHSNSDLFTSPLHSTPTDQLMIFKLSLFSACSRYQRVWLKTEPEIAVDFVSCWIYFVRQYQQCNPPHRGTQTASISQRAFIALSGAIIMSFLILKLISSFYLVPALWPRTSRCSEWSNLLFDRLFYQSSH